MILLCDLAYEIRDCPSSSGGNTGIRNIPPNGRFADSQEWLESYDEEIISFVSIDADGDEGKEKCSLLAASGLYTSGDGSEDELSFYSCDEDTEGETKEEVACASNFYEHEDQFYEKPSPLCSQPLDAWKPFATVDKRYLTVEKHEDDGIDNLTEFNPILTGMATSYIYASKAKMAYRVLRKIHDDLEHKSFETLLMRAECETALNLSLNYKAAESFYDFVDRMPEYNDEDVREWSGQLKHSRRHVGHLLVNIALYLKQRGVNGKRIPRLAKKGEMHIVDVFIHFKNIAKTLIKIENSTMFTGAFDYTIAILSGMIEDMSEPSTYCDEHPSDEISADFTRMLLTAICHNIVASFCNCARRFSKAKEHAQLGIELMEHDQVKNPSKHLVYGNLYENLAIAKFCSTTKNKDKTAANRMGRSSLRKSTQSRLSLLTKCHSEADTQIAHASRSRVSTSEKYASEEMKGFELDAKKARDAYGDFVLKAAAKNYQENLRVDLLSRVKRLLSK